MTIKDPPTIWFIDKLSCKIRFERIILLKGETAVNIPVVDAETLFIPLKNKIKATTDRITP